MNQRVLNIVATSGWTARAHTISVRIMYLTELIHVCVDILTGVGPVNHDMRGTLMMTIGSSTALPAALMNVAVSFSAMAV